MRVTRRRRTRCREAGAGADLQPPSLAGELRDSTPEPSLRTPHDLSHPPSPGREPSQFETKRVFTTWKSLVRVRVRHLRGDVDLIRARLPPDEPRFAEFMSVLDSVETALREAQNAAARATFWRSAITWLTGADIEEAWAALHRADELLYLARDRESLRARAPELLATVRWRIGKDDPRRDAYEEQLRAEDPSRELFREIRHNLNEISDDAHGRLRNYRNVVLAMTFILVVGTGLLAADAPSDQWLPIAHGKPPWPTIWQVELVGALGGLLAGVTTLRGLQGFAGPYALPFVMALLKIPAGALTGLLGALWMQNSIFTGLQPQAGLKILAFVALFGFAQQTLTTFADKQAGELLGQAKGTQPSTGAGAAP